MFQLDDDFLQKMGLGQLPDEQKEAFLAYFREQLELRVGTKLSDGLSDEQFAEFESFIDRDMDKVYAWLAANKPGYEQDQMYQKIKNNIAQDPQGGGAPTDDDILAEYASLEWLTLNRPNYKDVVAQTIEELRQEVIAKRDAILGAA